MTETFDQVSLNVLYAKNHVSLPNRYNTFTRMISRDRTKLLDKVIYHQAGHDYSFDPSNKLHQLFLEYLMRTPFFDVESLSNIVASARKHFENFQLISRQIANQLSNKTRIFFANSDDLDTILELFEAMEAEMLFKSEKSQALDALVQALKSKKYFCFVLENNFGSICQRLRNEGLVENIDFCNAMIFLRDDAEIKKFHVDLTNAM